eukprot:14731505-Alexandrium_andersonii.AAC.1
MGSAALRRNPCPRLARNASTGALARPRAAWGHPAMLPQLALRSPRSPPPSARPARGRGAIPCRAPLP